MSSSRPELRVDWATHKATVHACTHWHYTGTVPTASVKVGAWEDDRFIGVVLYGLGAGNSTRGDKYGLKRSHDIAELTRVALRDHVAPTSRIVTIATKMIRKQSPGLKMFISFADIAQGHHGGIYQAMGWVYTGVSKGDTGFIIGGRSMHSVSVHSKGWRAHLPWIREHIDPNAERAPPTFRHRYLLPLDDETRTTVEPMALPYPKRDKQAMAGSNPHSGGAAPTITLQPAA